MTTDSAQFNLRQKVLMLSIVTACYAAFQAILQALTPLAMADLDMSKTTIGLLQSLPGMITLGLGAPLARLANSRWRRATLTGAFALNLVACLLFSQARSTAGFVIPQFLYGLSSAAFWANMLATSFRLATGHTQTRIQGVITALQGVGYFGGPLLAGYLSGINFGWGFYAGALCAVIGLVATRGLRPAVAIETSRGVLTEWGASYVRLMRIMTRRPIVMLGMSFVFMDCFLLYVMGGTFFLLYARHLGLAVFMSTLLMSAREGIGALVRLTFSTISRHVQPVVLLATGTILGAICLGLAPLAEGAVGLGLVAIGAGAALAFLPPAVNMMSGAASAVEEQSFAILSLNTSNFAAQTLLSPLMGLALTAWGYRAVYPITSVVWVILALVALRIGLRLAGRTVPATNQTALPAQQPAD